MSKRLALIGLLMLGSLAVPSAERLNAALAPVGASTALPSCEWNKTLFPQPALETLTENLTVSEIWAKTYHDRVRAIIDAHQAPAGESLSCENAPVRAASAPLTALAGELSPWKGGAVATESDMGSVLLEHLRVYECSLRQRSFLLPSLISQEVAAINAVSNAAFGPIVGPQVSLVSLPAAYTRLAREETFIRSELELAGNALRRTLNVRAGEDRLAPLSWIMECLARASTDIANELGLMAEASACMPRTWDVNGSLFTPATL